MTVWHKLWTEKAVANRFKQAVLTLRKLPSVKTQGYANGWPDIVRLPHEVAYMEPNCIRLQATPDEIAALEQVLDWMEWIDIDERKVIWRRAANVGWRTICYEIGCTRTTAWHKWRIGLKKVAIQLNQKEIDLKNRVKMEEEGSYEQQNDEIV